jgi:hypothetical protein
MKLTDAKELKPGDVLLHSGTWAHRVGPARKYTVLESNAQHLRVTDSRGYVSLYTFGCAAFIAEDFLAACKLKG